MDINSYRMDIAILIDEFNNDINVNILTSEYIIFKIFDFYENTNESFDNICGLVFGCIISYKADFIFSFQKFTCACVDNNISIETVINFSTHVIFCRGTGYYDLIYMMKIMIEYYGDAIYQSKKMLSIINECIGYMELDHIIFYTKI